MNKTLATQIIKDKAYDLGFQFVGVSKAGFLEEEAPRLEKWLEDNHHGEMSYMENNLEKRLDPRLLVEGTKSVVSLLYNYYTEEKQLDPTAPKISMYALGKDYHLVIWDKMNQLFEFIQNEIGEVGGRSFVDSAPILDKAWAKKSGLGWIGKHTNLITKPQGSYFFISELLLDIDLDYDGPIQDYCGSCTKCIDACPTGAIIQPYQLDGSKCISYFTIELKDAIPQEMKGQFDNWMFGCDICQEVCPWNRFSLKHSEPDFIPSPGLLNMKKEDWEQLTQETFTKVFKNSPVKRTKYAGLLRNIEFLR